MSDKVRLYRFALFLDDDGSDTYDFGVVTATGDEQAMAAGFEKFVDPHYPGSSDAAAVGYTFFGGSYSDREHSFYTTELVEDAERAEELGCELWFDLVQQGRIPAGHAMCMKEEDDG